MPTTQMNHNPMRWASGLAAEGSHLQLKCTGCGQEVDATKTLGFSCPNAHKSPSVDHVLAPHGPLPQGLNFVSEDSSNPFIKYRELLWVYRLARSHGLSDETWVQIVEDLDQALIEVDGTGFQVTPFAWHDAMSVWAKDETGNVAQSHKARHLMLVMVYLRVLLALDSPAARDLKTRRLAVASCGNAGLAAATIAAAAKWPIDVYIPPTANEAVKTKLQELGATINICERDENTEGDPTVVAFRRAVQQGSIPFSVQGCDNGIAVQGSSTLIWEVISSLKEHGHDSMGSMLVHVGGGALGSGIVQGLRLAKEVGALANIPKFYTVQTEGGNPLGRAHTGVVESLLNGHQGPVSDGKRLPVLEQAAKRRNEFMWAWDNPQSVAHGILDDETYDWLSLVDGMLETGGHTVVVNDDRVREATSFARENSSISMCHTGAAGLAGVFELRAQGMEAAIPQPAVIIFSGLRRSEKD